MSKQKEKVTILYERLSRDDELQGPSNSIINQRQLLQDYAEKNGLTPYVHICDDGWSGTRWDRPGWQELIAKVEADEVFCLCIKDGSRMGRDYLRVGLYREMFREKGVRLVAVNDGNETADFLASGVKTVYNGLGRIWQKIPTGDFNCIKSL